MQGFERRRSVRLSFHLYLARFWMEVPAFSSYFWESWLEGTSTGAQ